MSYIFTNIDGSEITTIPLGGGIADYVKKNDTFETWRKKTNWLIQDSGRDIVLGTDTSGNFISTIAGTANQVLVSGSGSENSAVTLSLPQSIGTSSNVVFGNITGTVVTGSSLVATSAITSPSITVSGTGTFAVLSVSGSSNVTGKGTFGTVETPNLRVTSSADFTGVNVTAGGFTGTTANVTTITGNNITGSTSITSPSISATGNLFSPVANLTTLSSTTVTSTNGNFTNLSSNSSTIGSGTFSTSLTSNGTLLVLGNSEVRGDLSVTNGKKFVIPSGITNIRNNEYTWPASANVQNTFLRYGANGQLSWSEMNVLSSSIVFEDVVPVGVIVRWDKADGLPNTKWAYCTGQAISSLSITEADKSKLRVIYTGSSLPTTSAVIIKIASDFVKRFSVNLAEGITGTKDGSTVNLFDATSDSADAPTLVTLKVNYDTNTLALSGNQLKVKDNTFLSLASGGTVLGQVKVNGGTDITLVNNTGNIIVGGLSTTHVAVDSNTIQARNNNAASTLNLNPLGGAVTVAAVPTTAFHVVNKTYADSKLATSGGTITGAILYSPASFESTHLINKAFVDTNFLNKITGGSLSVPISSPAPSDGLHLVNKTYADSKVALAGGTVSGKILVTGSGATIDTGNQLVTKDYADTKLALAGGTINSGGSISWATAPTSPEHLVNKAFVDGNTLSSVKDSSTTGIISVGRDPTLPLELTTKQYVDRINDNHQPLKLVVNLKKASDFVINGPDITQWSRVVRVLNTTISYYEYTYNYFYGYEPYALLEPGHWIPTGIPGYLYNGIYEISSNTRIGDTSRGELKFVIRHSNLLVGYNPASVGLTVNSGKGTGVYKFLAALDGQGKAIVVSPQFRAGDGGNVCCFVNIKSGYELPSLSNDPDDRLNYSSTGVDLYRLLVSTHAGYGDTEISGTILSRNRTWDWISNSDHPDRNNQEWYDTRVSLNTDEAYTFTRRTIPVGIPTASYYGCINISYAKKPSPPTVPIVYSYISMASVGYNYSGNPANPLGSQQGADLFDDSAYIALGELKINQAWTDRINVKWNNNAKAYTIGFNAETPILQASSYPISYTYDVYFDIGNEGGGPRGSWPSSPPAVLMVSTFSVSDNKTRTYLLNYKFPYGKGGERWVRFVDGRWYFPGNSSGILSTDEYST